MSLAATLLAAGCSTPVTNVTLDVSTEVVDALHRYEVAYLIQPGDVIEVNQQKHAEFTRKVPVRPDGYVSLPLVGEVKVAGQTPADLSRQLQELFSRRLRNPEVTVIVENPPEPMVYVVGQLGASHAVPLRQAKTVAQAITQAGDATRSADLSAVSVIRLSAAGQLQALTLHFNGDDGSQPARYIAMSQMLLQPNDLVLVPESMRSQFVRSLGDAATVLTPIFDLLILKKIY